MLAGAARYFYKRNKGEIDAATGEITDQAKDYLQKKRNRIKSGLKGL
ncbi:MAG: hypothetical protein V4520_08760 [Bacteroidota bacterium]